MGKNYPLLLWYSQSKQSNSPKTEKQSHEKNNWFISNNSEQWNFLILREEKIQYFALNKAFGDIIFIKNSMNYFGKNTCFLKKIFHQIIKNKKCMNYFLINSCKYLLFGDTF